MASWTRNDHLDLIEAVAMRASSPGIVSARKHLAAKRAALQAAMADQPAEPSLGDSSREWEGLSSSAKTEAYRAAKASWDVAMIFWSSQCNALRRHVHAAKADLEFLAEKLIASHRKVACVRKARAGYAALPADPLAARKPGHAAQLFAAALADRRFAA